MTCFCHFILSLIFCTMPDLFFYWNKKYTVKAGFRLLSTLIQQRLSAHIEHPEEGILYASASSRWGYGAAQKYLKNQSQSQKQTCGPEELESTHFAASCPPPSYDFLVNTPTLTAATINWKRLLPPTPPVCHSFLLLQRITQICQLNCS